MSVIIRLQNLPWSARSGDIRHFFGGLRIPDGGVHIIGGEKGDAFIAFNTDEDARLAMRKDGGKIKDTRIKLLLSSHMEMQHVIDRITKQPSKASSPRSSLKDRQRSPERGVRKGRSPVRRLQRSPLRRSSDSKHRRRVREGSEEVLKRPNYKRSQSRSPLKRSISPVKRSDGFTRSVYSIDPKKEQTDAHSLRENLDISNWQSNEYKAEDLYDRRSPPKQLPNLFGNKQSTHDVPFQLRPGSFISEAEIRNYSHSASEQSNFQENRDLKFHSYSAANESNFPPNKCSSVVLCNEDRYPAHEGSFQLLVKADHISSNPRVDDWKVLNENRLRKDNVSSFHEDKNGVGEYPEQKPFPSDVAYGFLNPPQRDLAFDSRGLPNLLVPPPPFPNLSLVDGSRMTGSIMREIGPPFQNYCVRLTGLSTHSSFREVQAALKGTYAPQNNIQWEVDERGYKTAVAFVKLSNREDFIKILEKPTYLFDGKEIQISQCPDFLYRRYFPLENKRQIFGTSSPHIQNDLCYMLKGLPFSVVYDDIIQFFRGLRIADMCIIYEREGKATGTGFVEFSNSKDFSAAMESNGKKIGHRYIELLPSSKSELMEAKTNFGSSNCSSAFAPSQTDSWITENKLLRRRPLCALLTGLPPSIASSQISGFFSESGLKPFAIHVMLNSKRQPNGKAFVEFLDPLDFDAALKCHGKNIGNNMICVKQVLHDEMCKILETQKASHDFGISPHKDKSTNLPEKVPYLWEPPDANDHDLLSDSHEQNRFSRENFDRKSYNSNPKFSLPRHVHEYGHAAKVNFPRSNPQRDFFPELPTSTHLNKIHDSTRGQGLYRSDPEASKFSSTNINFRFEQSFNVDKPRSSDFTQEKNMPSHHEISLRMKREEHSLEEKLADVNDQISVISDDSSRIPVKFEVKIKQPVATSTKADDVFDRTMTKTDDKKKLSRLSPEKMGTITASCAAKNKTQPSTQQDKLHRKDEVKKKSPEASSRKRTSDENNKEGKIQLSPKAREAKIGHVSSEKKSEDDNRPKHKDKTSSEIRDKSNHEPRRSFERKPADDRYHRSSTRSRSNHRYQSSDSSRMQARDDKNESTLNTGCTVQLSNVHPFIGLEELVDFFHGFDLRKDRIIRRYTEHGDPTGDVRVDFRNSRDAQRAMNTLNGSYLANAPVEMFLI